MINRKFKTKYNISMKGIDVSMNKEKILKSELLKNIPIDVINQYENRVAQKEDAPISVYERDGNYYVLEGLDHLLKMNASGDIPIECYVTHKDSFL